MSLGNHGGGGGGRKVLSVDAKEYIPLSARTVPSQPGARVEASPAMIAPPISSEKSVAVKANHYLVTGDLISDISCYRVQISPSEEVDMVQGKKILDKLAQEKMNNRIMVYDGIRRFFTAGELPRKSEEFDVTLVDEETSMENKYTVKIAFGFKLETQINNILESGHNDEERGLFRFLNLLFLQEAYDRYHVIGRLCLDPRWGDGDLGNGVKFWTGGYHSVKPTMMGLSLNLEVTAKPFYQPMLVIDYIVKYFDRDLSGALTDQDLKELKKSLLGVGVEIIGQGIGLNIDKEGTRCFKIHSFTTDTAEYVMMEKEQISVSEYYKNLNAPLEYPYLPIIHARNIFDEEISLPMELWKILDGERYTKKLNVRQVTAFRDATCLCPQVREQKIQQIFIDNEFDKNKFVKGFGLGVRPDLTSIKARWFPPPRLKYHETGRLKFEEPHNGKWHMTDKKFVNGGRVNFWACINFSMLDLADVEKFCSKLIDKCSSLGMEFNKKPLIPTRERHLDQIEKSLKEIVIAGKSLPTKERLQLLIIILPTKNGKYGTIKRVLETELGILSQCCWSKKAMRPSDEYLEYVALKINVKVGGRNTVLEQAIKREMPCINEEHTIIFGSDVNHPKPGDKSRFSIAAVVATMDWPELTKYRSLVFAQAHRKEIIQDLYGMIRELLISYRNCNRVLPRKIIFYRDGVGEDKFNDVPSEEVTAIKNACKSFENYTPTITFVVVQKKHNTRLFPADGTGSILPGTVVDTEICHPSGIDFYLCSHTVNKVTSNATHYQVIYNDDDNSTNDDIQKLTYLLCYTDARCNKSVSIVPPAYYAHLAALRAHYYIEGVKCNDSQLPTIKIHDDVKDTMFFV